MIYYNHLFQFISIHSNLFQFISIYFNSFQFVSIYFNLLQFISIDCILMSSRRLGLLVVLCKYLAKYPVRREYIG